MDRPEERLDLSVAGMSCEHCRDAITGEVLQVPGVRAVDVDLGTKRVAVTGVALDEAAVRDAIGEAGYDVA